MPSWPKDFSQPIVVFVEGQDEVNVLECIFPTIDVTNAEARDVGGKDKLAINLPLAIKQSSFSKVRTIGVIQDADDDPAAAFDRVANVLSKNGIVTPAKPCEVVSDEKHRVAVLILPGGDRRGYLEDIFLEAHGGTPRMDCVNTFSQCCSQAGSAPFNSKAHAYALLVSLGAPETRMGRAFKAGVLTPDAAAYDVLKNFLRSLAED